MKIQGILEIDKKYEGHYIGGIRLCESLAKFNGKNCMMSISVDNVMLTYYGEIFSEISRPYPESFHETILLGDDFDLIESNILKQYDGKYVDISVTEVEFCEYTHLNCVKINVKCDCKCHNLDSTHVFHDPDCCDNSNEKTAGLIERRIYPLYQFLGDDKKNQDFNERASKLNLDFLIKHSIETDDILLFVNKESLTERVFKEIDSILDQNGIETHSYPVFDSLKVYDMLKEIKSVVNIIT